MSQPFYPCDYTDIKETARYVNSTQLEIYLNERFGEERVMEMITVHGDSVVRRWFRWRVELSNPLIDIFSVDEFLMKCFSSEVMLHDLDEVCFSFADRKRWSKGEPVSPELRQRCIDRVMSGEKVREVAAEIERSYDCVAKWVRDERKQAVAA